MLQHKLALCEIHYPEWFVAQTARAIKKYRMFGPDERVLVAVSGGKDSLALWNVLLQLGYQADGLYIDLGIDGGIGYSAASREKVEQFAAQRPEARFTVVDIKCRVRGDAAGGGPAGAAWAGQALLGVRADQAARDEPRDPRRRLRRARHRPQPGRRGGGALWQPAPLADRLPRPPGPGVASQRRRVGSQGQALLPPLRTGDGRLRAHHAASTTSTTSAPTPWARPASATRGF